MKHISITACSIALLLLSAACHKESVTEWSGTPTNTRTVIDYALDYEGMYQIKYKVLYNRHLQVETLLRGEKFADISQLQLIAKFYYKEPASTLPDSVEVFNVKGKKAGAINKDFNKIAPWSSSGNYTYPERRNDLLNTPGAAALLAIAGKDVDWGGTGHLGGSGSIKILDHLKMLNLPSLKDTITGKEYYSWTKEWFYRGYEIRFNSIGLPVQVMYTDNLNPAVLNAEVAYKQQ